MKTYINGMQDINTIIRNERKLGGAVEAEFIRLRTGEEFGSPVITSIDTDGTVICAVGFFTKEGKRLLVGVNELSMISEPTHKYLHQLTNSAYKSFKTEEKVKYLIRLCELNEGSETPVFKEEVKRIVEDIGEEALLSLDVQPSFLQPARRKISVA